MTMGLCRGSVQISRLLLLYVAAAVILATFTSWTTRLVSALHFDDEEFLDVASISLNGADSLKEGLRLLKLREYDDAAPYLWRAVLLHEQSTKPYDVQDAFSGFLQTYSARNKLADGFLYVAKESVGRGQVPMAKMYLQQALQVDPDHEEALQLQEEIEVYEQSGGTARIGKGKKQPKASRASSSGGTASRNKQSKRRVKIPVDEGGDTDDDDDDNEVDMSNGNVIEWDADAKLKGKSPEEMYEIASKHFSDKNYEECADIFEISCVLSDYRVSPSCANAVYCRNYVLDWGFNGTQFENDMLRITNITLDETDRFRAVRADGSFAWRRATSVHPHMMLGYPVDPMLKRYVTESVAFLDEQMARVKTEGGRAEFISLPDDMPFDPKADLADYVFEFKGKASPPKIRVGFVASGFNSKAVLYLSHDMFRFFDKSRFEIHIFSMGPPDHPMFIQHGMRGVDWRERVKANVDRFHDLLAMKMDHVAVARYIHDQQIHILIEWDGYARQGERAQGLLALRPAPVQMLHQEYLGTSGAQYVDYIFSDKVTSPPHLADKLYTEKLIYMPNHFFSKGHAVQKEVKPPTYDYVPKTSDEYELGRGSPQENRCMAESATEPSFVFCNFNKFLKNNPRTVRSWIRILREVPDSMLCLLENPDTGVPYLRKFVHEAAGTNISSEKDVDSFVAGDGDALNDRIHFLPWQKNPFDHQMRNQDFCNVMLDSYPYNGHTVAQDALYGGVPIVTRSDGDDMCARVSTSANLVLGLDELNAYYGPKHYEDIAIAIGTNNTMYQTIRNKLIDTALQRNPMHPYWDVPRYVKNFEMGLTLAWERYLDGLPPDHITIEETEEAKQGTYDETLLANPPDGKKSSKSDEL